MFDPSAFSFAAMSARHHVAVVEDHVRRAMMRSRSSSAMVATLFILSRPVTRTCG